MLIKIIGILHFQKGIFKVAWLLSSIVYRHLLHATFSHTNTSLFLWQLNYSMIMKLSWHDRIPCKWGMYLVKIPQNLVVWTNSIWHASKSMYMWIGRCHWLSYFLMLSCLLVRTKIIVIDWVYGCMLVSTLNSNRLSLWLHAGIYS